MAKINRFEDIEAWKKARELTKEIYKITSSGSFSKDYGLEDQIRRASVSVVSNIAEGFARKTDKEFARFLTQSHGSAAEIQSILYVALDQNYITQEQFGNSYSFAEKTSKMIMNFTLYLTKDLAK
ncbi:four helix bundle protein [candidate division WOR-3 bacterium]|nr:four helix bundle protein [candidate division WOR-3 bacterium]